MKVLFFDTETTGFKSATYTPRLVQLGAILQDSETKRVLAEFNGMVVTEGFEIPEVVTKIHGVTNELADAHGFMMHDVDVIFSQMVAAADLVVAHNIEFDLGIVSDNLDVSPIALDKKQKFCTMLNSTKLVGIRETHGRGSKWPRLMEAYQYFFKTEFDNAHDAMADVRACRDVYFALTAKAEAQTEPKFKCIGAQPVQKEDGSWICPQCGAPLGSEGDTLEVGHE